MVCLSSLQLATMPFGTPSKHIVGYSDCDLTDWERRYVVVAMDAVLHPHQQIDMKLVFGQSRKKNIR